MLLLLLSHDRNVGRLHSGHSSIVPVRTADGRGLPKPSASIFQSVLFLNCCVYICISTVCDGRDQRSTCRANKGIEHQRTSPQRSLSFLVEVAIIKETDLQHNHQHVQTYCTYEDQIDKCICWQCHINMVKAAAGSLQ